MRCYLDGELIHGAEIAPLPLPWLYAVAGLDEQQQEAILKVVHGATSHSLTILRVPLQ